MRFYIVLFFSLVITSIIAQNGNPAYVIYNAKGKRVSFQKMVKQTKKAEVILFGEHHDNPIAHWLALELFTRLAEEDSMMLGLEMLEVDQQSALDSFMLPETTYRKWKETTRLWGNFATDYLPLLEAAKSRSIPVLATNIPRKYASMVYKKGFEVYDSLSSVDQQYFPPWPIEYDPNLPGYQKMKSMMPGHGGENLPKAQALKDATMAHRILMNLSKDRKFFHLNGSYHSDFYEGIVYYLRLNQPNIHLVTISTVSQPSVDRLLATHKGKADFILCIPENMAKSYTTQ